MRRPVARPPSSTIPVTALAVWIRPPRFSISTRSLSNISLKLPTGYPSTSRAIPLSLDANRVCTFPHTHAIPTSWKCSPNFPLSIGPQKASYAPWPAFLRSHSAAVWDSSARQSLIRLVCSVESPSRTRSSRLIGLNRSRSSGVTKSYIRPPASVPTEDGTHRTRSPSPISSASSRMSVSLLNRWWYPRSSSAPPTSNVDACPPRNGARSCTTTSCPSFARS